MRAFVTGGGGFIGGVLVRRLRERGDEVVVAVREPAAAAAQRLAHQGAQLLRSDLRDTTGLAESMRGADAVFHLAGAYRVGIAPSERRQMHDSNVGATERVLDAGIAAGVNRTVHVSTINVFGNTRGQIVDESYRRDLRDGFVSWYDETKFRAHEAAEARIRGGAPIVIVQPGGTYGPGDHSTVGAQLAQAHAGRLRYLALASVGLNFVHVEDVVEGILLAHDRGQPGRAYVLGGEIARLRDAISVAARLGGHGTPRLTVPTRLLRLATPVAPRLGRFLGLPPNLDEVIRASDRVTYWASDERARAELGYKPRGLEAGLADTFGDRLAA
ncbi:MAG: NAD-dependent epimerase/dehydratase family protein [Chloroflexi bacterium]|nr:NAD-dependent epimerase/dehydratase family protein [Chloroflexota bacterium]